MCMCMCMCMGIVSVVVVTALPSNTVLSISDVCQSLVAQRERERKSGYIVETEQLGTKYLELEVHYFPLDVTF